jgi:hypothetical protein
MNLNLTRLLPRVSRSSAGPACPVCREPLGAEPAVRVRGMRVHRFCLGYREREIARHH